VKCDEWFSARIPPEWGARGVDVASDQDEIVAVVDLGDDLDGADDAVGLRLFRERSRDERMALAKAAEATFGKKVSWGAKSGSRVLLFTTSSVPVMTRLRLPERQLLDTLIDAGVARTRSEALAWCVRLVAANEQQWITDLRRAFEAVEAVRERGPASSRRDL
jgi:hypothetical protein